MTLFKCSYLLGVLALGFASVANAQEQKVAEVVPGAYIVEFAESSIGTPAFYQNLTDCDIKATPRETLAYELFNGASFQLEDGLDNKTTIETIQSMGIVSKIWPVRLIDRPARTPQDFEFSVGSKANAALSKRAETDEFSTHVMTGVNKLHAEGYLGEGLYIGVIDSGVDYNHPALGGGFGPEYKVVAGYDLVGDEYNGGNTPVPDNDPMDCGGHGTHVSGIIAADDNPFNFTGVVPQAKLGVWKVFGCDGPVSNDILIRAFNMAYEAGVDMISASIGGPSGWTEEPWDVAVQRITEKGVPCILSAGNDGSNGLFYTSTASESIGTTSVGSIDNTIQLDSSNYEGDYSVDNGTSATFAYAPGTHGDFGSITAPLYAVTLDNTVTADACNSLPDSTPDLSPYVVLIRRGTCSFDVKVSNVLAYNATKVLFYNNAAGIAVAPGSNNPDVPAGMVSSDQGSSWISTLKTGSAVTVTLKPLSESEVIFVSSPNTATGGKMRTSSSWGPSYELWLKPEVAAPGGLILSTVPLSQGGYGVKSGTSMAAPFISGVIGLIKQIRGKDTFSPDALTSLLASTAVPVDFNDGSTTYPYLAPVAQQGGGLVDAYEAVYTNSLLNVDNIALNDTTFFVPDHPVTISNIGDVEQTYTFSNILAAAAYTFTDSVMPASFPPDLTADTESGAGIEFDPPVLTIAAKSQGTVNLVFTPPTGLDASRLPVYGGFVAINGSAGDSLSLPYAGVAARMRDVQIINSDYGYPFFASSNALNVPVTSSNLTFSLPGPNSTATSTTGQPSLSLLLAMGTRLINVDVIAVSSRGGKTVIGSVPGWPVEYSYRNQGLFPRWTGQLASGEWAPSGLYTLKLRVLKILGDEAVEADYEVFESPIFTINYI